MYTKSIQAALFHHKIAICLPVLGVGGVHPSLGHMSFPLGLTIQGVLQILLKVLARALMEAVVSDYKSLPDF